MAVVLLVRFGELALKSRFVRRQLRDRLVGNIQDMFASEGLECVTEADEARIYVHTANEARARSILARVFGIVSVSPATETRTDTESLQTLVLAQAEKTSLAGKAFALRVRRVGSHPFTSLDLAKRIGAAVLAANPGSRVDLSTPDVEIHVEVRQNRGFVFREIWPGPGGLPLGSQGRALAVVDDSAGMVAAWLGMKRGCRVAVASRGSADHVEPLRRWDTHLKVLEAGPHATVDELARMARADALILGTCWAHFEPTRRPTVSVPIFEPVIGLEAGEIAHLAATVRSA